MRRWLLFLPLLAASAWAACADRPYVLETEEGLLGGENLSYEEGVLLVEGRACLERPGLALEAPWIRYLEEEGGFLAPSLSGEVEGWRLQAEGMEGKALLRVRLAKGSLRAEAERLLLERPPKGEGVFLEAPAYRVRAERATFTGEEARLQGFLATPCPCGEDLRLAMEEALFRVDTGELVGDAALGLFGLEVPLEEARLNVHRRPSLASPFILSATEEEGLTLGLKDLPLPQPGEEVGRWSRRLTLMGTGLNSPQAALLLGLKEGGLGAEVQLGYAAGVRAFGEGVYLAYTPNPPDTTTPRLEARYAPSLRLEGLALTPFLRYAETEARTGLTLGAEGSYRLEAREGPFRLALTPSALLALYPGLGHDPYLVLGGSAEAGYGEGPFRARLLYAGRYAALSPTPAFAYEERAEFQSLQVEAGFAEVSLLYRLENPLGDRVDRVEAAYAAEGLGRLALAWVRGSYAEWRLAYAPPLPQRTCCQALWLAPELGLGPEGPSRYGLTLRYYDGCFAYEVRAARVLQGQHDEATGYTLSFGLTLR